MGAQNGKDLLIKVDLTGDGQFETIAGLRATRVSFNAESGESLEDEGKYIAVSVKEADGCWRNHWVLWNSDTPWVTGS